MIALRLYSSSLSNFVDNLSEGLYNCKCDDCHSYLNYIKKTKSNNKLFFKYFDCKKNDKKDFNKDLIKRFENAYEFCDRDINKFILLSRKGVYPGEYMESWERFDEELLPDKEAFYSSLNM